MDGWHKFKVVDWDEIRLDQIQDNYSAMAFTYKGRYDKMPDLQLMYRGDLIFVNDKEYVHTGDTWEELGALNKSTREEVIEEPIFSNCRNCGSPLILAGRCAYCGTPQPTRTITRRF